MLRPLTARVIDAVTYHDKVPHFRGKEIGKTPTGELSYVADASALGEVFFASNNDLANLTHEPRPGGMPKVVLPPNIKGDGGC